MIKDGYWELLRKDLETEEELDFPSEWDINCGYCERWALLAKKRYGGQALWLDTINPLFGEEELDICHCVLYLNNLYYDSQHPNGVLSVFDLDIANYVTRSDFLKRKEEEFFNNWINRKKCQN